VEVYEYTATGRMAGRQEIFTVVRSASRDPSGGLVLAHGGSRDGRHHLLEEGISLAAQGLLVCLPASSLPAHGDWAETERGIRRSVLVHRTALDLITALAPTVDRFGFFGHSAGAFQGSILRAVEPRLSAVVLAGFGSGTLVRVAAAELENEPEPGRTRYLRELEAFDPSHYLALPGRAPVMLQFGTMDETVPDDEAQRLAGATAPPILVRRYQCGHAIDHPQARSDRAEFFIGRLTCTPALG